MLPPEPQTDDMVNIEIDADSGYCFGVVTAIRKAEEELEHSGSLFCLGDIVHNSDEVERLRRKGLKTITHADLGDLHDVKVLLRAHGEPPSTYRTARANDIDVIDATCPVVLQLQRRIKQAYDMAATLPRRPLFIIYGKEGHAEVNGLVGQTDGEAIVVQNEDELDNIDLDRDILLWSQTTKSPEGFAGIVDAIRRRKKKGTFQYFDTICRQVSGRMSRIREFARAHQAVVFVSGSKSSNGKVLFAECKKANPSSMLVSNVADIDLDRLRGVGSIGICGATSTPAWLMADIRDYLKANLI